MTASVPTGSSSSAAIRRSSSAFRTRDRPPRVRAGFRRSVARAQGRGLAARRALRFCRAARRDVGAHEAFALDHRRQSRSERRFALSRSGDDRTRPDHDLRRRAALSGGPGAGRGGNRRAAAPYFDPYHAALAARSLAAPEVSARRAVRRPLHSLGHPAAVRRRTAGVQSRDEFRRKLRPGLRETVGAVLAASAKLDRRRALQGRLDHARLWQPSEGVEALQLELACRAYMQEPERRRRQLAYADRRKARATRDAQARSEAILRCA